MDQPTIILKGQGPTNVIADIFSQLMRKDSPASLVLGKNVPVNGNKEESDNLLENYFSWTDDRELLDCFMNLPKEECFLNLPVDMVNKNPLDMGNMKEWQNTDKILQDQATKYEERYVHKRVGIVYDILCYIKPGDSQANWKIALPKDLLMPTIKWFAR
jgi:hypothetical protein